MLLGAMVLLLLQRVVLSHPQALKALSPGRVIVINKPLFRDVLSVVLQSGSPASKERTFTVLAMCEMDQAASSCDNQVSMNEEAEESESLPKPYAPQTLFHPEGACGQQLVHIKVDHIATITTKTLKISAEKIVDDCKKRQMPRFR